MRPRQQLCGELRTKLGGGTARSMGVRRSEEQHQRKQHKEVVKGEGERRSVKTGTKKREGNERWGMAAMGRVFFFFFQPGNSARYCAHSEYMCRNSMQQTVHNNQNNDF